CTNIKFKETNTRTRVVDAQELQRVDMEYLLGLGERQLATEDWITALFDGVSKHSVAGIGIDVQRSK
ncbi:hypothetical protein Pmar_PMAR018101, partial [Perkinsus marinus ATCC 50983]